MSVYLSMRFKNGHCRSGIVESVYVQHGSGWNLCIHYTDKLKLQFPLELLDDLTVRPFRMGEIAKVFPNECPDEIVHGCFPDDILWETKQQ